MVTKCPTRGRDGNGDSSKTGVNVMRFLWDGSETERRQGAALREIAAYWEALRAGRDMPRRCEVSPRGIEKALRHAFILERMAPGMARIRVTGDQLGDLLGMDPAGMPVSACFGPSARDSFRDVLEAVFQSPARARLTLEGERGIARPSLSAEMILLPMRSARGDVTRILGGLEMTGQIGARPRRFVLKSSFLRRLRDDGEIVTAAPMLRSGPPASLPRTVSTKAPYLRLVVTDQ